MGKALRVLVVEDSPLDARLVLREMAKGGYDVTYERVDTPEATRAALARQTWDVVLADYNMPHFSGLDALNLVKESGLDLPYLVVSGAVGEEQAAELMREGAHDFIRKDNLARLVPAVERELREAAGRRERRRAQEALRQERAFLRRVIDAAPSMIFVKDWDGRFILVNEALGKCYGAGVEGVQGKTDADFNSNAEEVAHFRRDDQEVISTRHSKLIPSENVTCADGTTRLFSTIKVPLINQDGTCDELLGVATDITERQQAEDRLLQAEAEKKRFYREVIRAVTHDKLHLVDATEIPTEGRVLLDVVLQDAASYRLLRRRLQEIAEGAGMAREDAADLVLAMGEAVTNAIKHAEGGICTLYVTPERVIVRVSDGGSGIRPENIPATLLLPGFSTQVSLGMGYTVMLQMVDTIWLATGPEGTVVQLCKWIHPREHAGTPTPPAWERL